MLSPPACYKPGERSRTSHAVCEYNGRKDQPKGFGWRDFRSLLIRARVLGSVAQSSWYAPASGST